MARGGESDSSRSGRERRRSSPARQYAAGRRSSSALGMRDDHTSRKRRFSETSGSDSDRSGRDRRRSSPARQYAAGRRSSSTLGVRDDHTSRKRRFSETSGRDPSPRDAVSDRHRGPSRPTPSTYVLVCILSVLGIFSPSCGCCSAACAPVSYTHLTLPTIA